MRIDANLLIPMTDGTRLATDVYHPGDISSDSYPVILIRTPYNKSWVQFDKELVTTDGFVLAIQDVRGRFQSEGGFNPFRDERSDGVDTINWIREQLWCDGKVGMASCSYVGATQWFPALEHPKGLLCAAPEITGNISNGFVFFTRGVIQLDMFLLWIAGLADEENRRRGRTYSDSHPELKAMREVGSQQEELLAEIYGIDPSSPGYADLGQKVFALDEELTRRVTKFLSQPLSKAAAQISEYAPWLRDWLDNIEDPDSDYWKEIDWDAKQDDISIPMLHQAAWHDVFVRGQLKDFAGLSSRDDCPPQKLVVLPEVHMSLHIQDILPIGEKLFPVSYVTDAYGLNKAPAKFNGQLTRRWHQEWLLGSRTGVLDEPPITLYVQGEEAWRDEWEWPLARTDWTPLFLQSTGFAHCDTNDGALRFDKAAVTGCSSDQFAYDPANPVQSRGGTFLSHGIAAGIFEQSSVESRKDVLVYTSFPLNTDLEVTGPVAMKLWASTSAVDTDFTAKLVVVEPDGRAFNICDGVTRLRYREQRPGLITPGEVQEVEIELSPTSFLFRPGQRIRLQISSSNFPLFDPNPNTGKSLLNDESNEMVVALQTVFHDAQRPSHLILPVIPRGPDFLKRVDKKRINNPKSDSMHSSEQTAKRA